MGHGTPQSNPAARGVPRLPPVAQETGPVPAQGQHHRHPLGGGAERGRRQGVAQAETQHLRGPAQHPQAQAQERHGGVGGWQREERPAQEVVGECPADGMSSLFDVVRIGCD